MDLAYYKRFRMEIPLAGRLWTPPPLPTSYFYLPWEESLLDAFSQAKYLSFRDAIDAAVFPCFLEFEGCRRLMRDISQRRGFLPETTWLLVHAPGGGAKPEYCGTVQGIRETPDLGAIQNLGVVPGHRGLGLGKNLLQRALAGFGQSGVQRVHLEVTAENHVAIRLYRQLGFTVVRSLYKAVETECSK